MLTKVLVTLGFVAAATASGYTENLCLRDGKALMSSGANYNWCVEIPQSQVMNNWGGGRSSKCQGGNWERYWKITGVDYARVCHGPRGSCTKHVAQKNDYIAGKIGADKCWSVWYHI